MRKTFQCLVAMTEWQLTSGPIPELLCMMWIHHVEGWGLLNVRWSDFTDLSLLLILWCIRLVHNLHLSLSTAQLRYWSWSFKQLALARFEVKLAFVCRDISSIGGDSFKLIRGRSWRKTEGHLFFCLHLLKKQPSTRGYSWSLNSLSALATDELYFRKAPDGLCLQDCFHSVT